MKRKYFIYAASCVLCLLSSCNNEVWLEENQQERNENTVSLKNEGGVSVGDEGGGEEIEMTDFESLQAQTEDFNAIFFEEMYPDLPIIPVGGRGFFSWLWFVVQCDAGGALIGALVSGGSPVGTLAGCILGSLGGLVSTPDYCAVDEIIDSNDYYDNGSEIGIVHNEIIREMFNENGSWPYEHTIYDLSQFVAEKMELHGYDSSPLFEAEFENEFIEYMETMDTNRDFFLNHPYELWNYVTAQPLEYEDEMSYLSNYMYYVDGIIETGVLAEYTDYLTDIVRESEISESSKTMIIDVMSVYVNSRILWYHENW